MGRQIAGLVVVITGASSGIGEATARLLAARGARVVLAARRVERLVALATSIERAGGQALVVPTDVRDEAACRALIERVLQHWGRIDVLINNAGLGHRALAGQLDAEQVREQVEVNLLGAIWCTNAAIPALRRQGSGQIINIGSVAGTIGVPSASVYSATKFALDGFSQALHGELAHFGIDVTLVCPGFIETEFNIRSSLNDERPLVVAPPMTAEYLAGWIARLIQRPRRKVVMTWHYHLVSVTNRLLPSLAAWITSLVGASIVRRLERRPGIQKARAKPGDDEAAPQ